MEFNEKLQKLRKQRGLTQEELAEVLYVSRTAVSKWESGRGYPSIDSLKAIAQYFRVTIDELLSGDELLTIAETDAQQKEAHFGDRWFGLLDCSAALLFVLPLFAERINGFIQAVSLMALSDTEWYLKIACLAVSIGMVVAGILTLAFQNSPQPFWQRNRYRISLTVNTAGVLLFIISLQPYAAVLLFVFLAMKGFFLVKKQ